MNMIVIAFIFFVPIISVFAYFFYVSIKRILIFKKIMRELSKEYSWTYMPEKTFFRLLITFFKKHNKEAFNKLFTFILKPYNVSAKLIGNVTLNNRKYEILISSKVVKFKEFHIPVSYIKITPVNADFYFEISNKDLFHNLEKLILKDVQFNNKPFDDRFLILTNNEHRIKQVITSDIVNALLKLNNNARIILNENYLYFEEERYFTDIAYLKWVIMILINILKNI